MQQDLIDEGFKPEDHIRPAKLKYLTEASQLNNITSLDIQAVVDVYLSSSFVYANYLRKFSIQNAKGKIGSNKKIQNFILYSVLEKDEKFQLSKRILLNLEHIFSHFSGIGSSFSRRLKTVLKESYNNSYVIME